MRATRAPAACPLTGFPAGFVGQERNKAGLISLWSVVCKKDCAEGNTDSESSKFAKWKKPSGVSRKGWS